jgi:hypothetical protein
MTPEEYVRSKLSDVYWDKRFYNRNGDIVHLGWSICFAETEEEGWRLAFEWTKDRERQIAEVEEEIARTAQDIGREQGEKADYENAGYDVLASDCDDRIVIYGRILARLQSTLADLRKGMK